MPEHPDLMRLRAEYANRTSRPDINERYTFFNTAYLFALQQRQRSFLRILQQHHLTNLESMRILDLGSGWGGTLLELLRLGASTTRLHGTDLLFSRVQSTRKTISNLPLTNADAQNLPYAKYSFDLVLQFMVFSSILDDDVRHNLARESVRVMRPGALIIWYDFWTNPINHQTRGIAPPEIRSLFPGCSFQFHRITLAPPLARAVVPFSWSAALFLEYLKIFNTHYLVAIQVPR